MIKKGISNSTLKLIAMIAMLLDHIGAVILEPMMVQEGLVGLVGYDPVIYQVNRVLRLVIGRMAFPIFCFLLVEGVMRTSHVLRYAGRLFVASLVSEVAFDLALNGVWLERGYQNVMFTLLIGVLVMAACNQVEEKKWNPMVLIPVEMVIWMAGIFLADVLRTDYGGYGILCIGMLYFFRKKRTLQLWAGSVTFVLGELLIFGGSSELLAPLGFLAAYFYDNRRGWKVKYLFYAFYPVHLILLFLVKKYLGI